MEDTLIEKFIQMHGEQYRGMLVDALVWLDKQEPIWALEKPISRIEFLENLIEVSTKKQ